MKFLVSSGELLKKLSMVSGVIPSNPILPVLENFLFELEGNELTIRASDMAITMMTKVEVEGEIDGNLAVPAKLLMETIKSLPEQPVTFTANPENFALEVVTAVNKGKYRLAGEDPVEFPSTQQVPDEKTISLSVELLDSVINTTLFATSTDESRAAMSGVLFQLNKENAVFAATDGHKLVRYTRHDVQSEEEASLIFPRKTLNLLKNTLHGSKEAVNFAFTSGHAMFRTEKVTLVSRLIDEVYPSYENAIPKENPNLLEVNKLDLQNSIKRISIYANKSTQQLRLSLTETELTVSAEDLDFNNEAKESLKCTYSGAEFEIGFNGKFLLDVLTHMEHEEIKFELSEPNRAVLVLPQKDEENENLLMLVMPVMLNNY